MGRQHELTVLRDKLLRPGTVAISAVAGMGGVGKTELATQYLRQPRRVDSAIALSESPKCDILK